MRKKGMKLLSKTVAACFALILTVSMAMPVQANIGKEETHKITVTGKATDGGATVDVYRIIEVSYDYDVQQPIAPTYRWVEPVASWMKNQDKFKEYVGEHDEVTKSFEVTGATLSELMRELENAIRDKVVLLDKAVASKTINKQNPVLTFENLKMGQYLILTTSDKNGEYKNYKYVPATANIVPVYDEEKKEWFAYDANVTIKGSPAEIEKTVTDHTVEIGQKVNYTVNVPVPYYPSDAVAKLFRIGDYLPLGITFGNTYEENKLTVNAVYENGDKKQIGTSEKDANEFKLYYYAKDNGKDGVLGNQGSTEDSNLADFILNFVYDKLMENYGSLEKDNDTFALKSIEVTYTGTINKNAILRPGDPGYPENADPLENKAYVGQNNNPYDSESYEPTEDKEKVYTYAINVAKVSEDGKTLLPGAEFQLLREDKKTVMGFVKLGEGHYRLAKANEADADVLTELVVGSAGDNEGKLQLEGLTTGTYYLKETKAPDGYEILKDLIEVKIVDDNEDGIVDNAGDKTDKSANTNIVYKTVVNRKPPIMPITGGMGTVLFSVVGIILVVGGVTLITTYLKRKRA